MVLDTDYTFKFAGVVSVMASKVESCPNEYLTAKSFEMADFDHV